MLSAGESVYVPGNVRHGAKALAPGTLIDVFTPVREDLLRRYRIVMPPSAARIWPVT